MQVKCELTYGVNWEELDWEAVKKHEVIPKAEDKAVREFIDSYEQLILQFPNLIEEAAVDMLSAQDQEAQRRG